jgi:SpoVK/Ycf46/Vps4 family AAA+-type ATPase
LSLEPGVSFDTAVTLTAGYSAAELELIILAAANRAAESDREAISQDDVDQATKDVIPSRDSRMLRYMELLAVFEASARRTLPDRYRDMTTEQVQAEIDALQISLGRRAT